MYLREQQQHGRIIRKISLVAFTLTLSMVLQQSFAQNVVKQLYLSAPGQSMDRVLPSVGDATATSAQIGRIANNGQSIYHTNNDVTPNFRIFNGVTNTYGTAADAITVAANTASVLMTAQSPTDPNEAFFLEINASRKVYLQRWDGTSWTLSGTNPVNGAGVVRATGRRSAAIAYSSDGNALMVWDNTGTNNVLNYRTYNGTTKVWSGDLTYTFAGNNAPIDQMILVTKPNSNEIMLAFSDATNDYALVWNGSTWGNGVTLNTTTSVTQYDINVAYEQLTGRALVVYAKADNGNIYYRTWNGTAWSAETQRTFSGAAPAGTGATSSTVNATSMASRPNSNTILLAFTTNAPQAVFMTWNGTSFTTTNATDYRVFTIPNTSSNQQNISPIRVAFESQSGEGLGVAQSATANVVNVVTWTSSGGYSANSNSAAFTNTPTILDLAPDTFSDKIMLSVNASANAQTMLWSGTAWGTAVLQANVGLTGAGTVTNNGLPITYFWSPSFTPPTSFTQTTALCSGLTLPNGGAVNLSTYINFISGSLVNGQSYAIRAALRYGTTNIVTLNTATYNSANGTLNWSGTILGNNNIPAGQQISLDITVLNNPNGALFTIQYDSPSKPSQVQLTTSTFIKTNSIQIFSSAIPGSPNQTELINEVTYFARVNVSDPFGTSDINGLDFSVINDLGTTTVSLTDANVVSTSGCEKTYEYAFTIPVTGVTSYNFSATSKEGSEGTVTSTLLRSNVPVVGLQTNDDDITIDAGELAAVDVLANDLGATNPASVTIVSQPVTGTVQVDGLTGVVTWLPPLGNFSGFISFDYQVCRTGFPNQCGTATITIRVNPDLTSPCDEALIDKTYYMPFPENTSQLRLSLINAAGTTCGTAITNNVRTITSIKSSYFGTVMYYDHWEDGYETNILQPQQSTTLVWGDGNTFNGIAPGYPSDIIPAGGSIVLDNTFTYNPRNASTIVYDGKDKIYATGNVAISKVAGDLARFNIQAVKTNVDDISRFGKDFTVGLGEIFPIANFEVFQYTALFITASQNGTTVQLDFNADGTTDRTQILNEGEVWFYEGDPAVIAGPTDIRPGARIVANKPVGVQTVFGGKDCFGTRNITILPGKFYGASYYTPVGTTVAANPNAVYFVNTNKDTVTINSQSSTTTFTPIRVPGTTGLTYFDQFNTNGVGTGSDGTKAWATNWTETGEADGFGAGSIRVANNQLEIRGNGTTTVAGALRSFDILTANRANLSFTWSKVGLALASDSILVQIATSNAGPWTTLQRLDATGATSGTSSIFIDNRTFNSATATIRFVTANNALLTTAKGVNFDDIKVTFTPINFTRVTLNQSSGYKFWSDYATKRSFTAIEVMDAGVTGSPTFSVSGYDWSITLIDSSRLTSFAAIAWAPGSTAPPANYNPIWVTPTANTTIYVKYDGNLTGTAANSVTCTIDGLPVVLPYDVAINANALTSNQIKDPIDNDQSGMAVFTCNTPLSVVWGQDANGAPGGSPALDVGTTMAPSCLARFVNAVDNYEVTEPNTAITVNVVNNDVGFLCKVDPLSVSISAVGLQPAKHGTAVVNANGTITYTPSNGYVGLDSLEYQACALAIANTCDRAFLIINVTPCGATSVENLVKGDVFLELLSDDGQYNNEASKADIQVDLYSDLNCNNIIDGADAVLKSTITSDAGNFQFSVFNGDRALDDFDPTASLTGNDGTVNWSSDWLKFNDGGTGISAGDVRIILDTANSNAIRIGGATTLSAEGISRNMNFVNAVSAYLKFQYRRQNLNNTGESISVWLNQGQPNAKLVTTLTYGGAPGTDLSYINVAIPLLASDINTNGSNTLSFQSSSTGLDAANEYFWIDDVELGYAVNKCYIAKVNPPANYAPSLLDQAPITFGALQNCTIKLHIGIVARLVATADAATTATDVPVVINVLANDIGLPNIATLVINTPPGQGQATVNADGTITYSPSPGFTGSENFTYRVCSLEDPNVCATGTVTVNTVCTLIPNQYTITGVVYDDANANGSLNAGENGRSGVGVTLYLDANNNGTLEAGETTTSLQTTTTGTTGGYQFNIPATTVTSTYRDEFTNNTTANQTAGTVDWTGNSWTKIGEGGNFGSNNIRITNNDGLRITGSGSTTQLGAYRTAPIPANTGIATLSYRTKNDALSSSNDWVDIQVASTATGGTWTTLQRIVGPLGNTGNNYTSYSWNIDQSNFSATTTIRFISSNSSGMTSSERVYFDDVQIAYTPKANYFVRLTQPIPTGLSVTGPTNVASPLGFYPVSFNSVGTGICQRNFGVAGASLVITKTNTPTTILAGQTIGYAITVKNNGPSTATGVNVLDVFPTGVAVNSTPVASQGSWSSPNWSVGTLANGATATLTFTAAVDAGLLSNTITNRATVTSTSGNPNLANNEATSTASVNTSADLAITKTVNNSTPTVNSNVVFTVTASNSGPSNAQNVNVTDLLPSGYSFVSSTASTGTYNFTTGLWSIGALARLGTATLQITARVLSAGNYLNTATITSNTFDPVSVNNSASATVYSVVALTSASVTEGGSLVHDVTLNQPTDAVTQFPYSVTYNGTTTAADFAPDPIFTNGVTAIRTLGVITGLSVPAGVSSFSIVFPTIDDNVSEPNETYSLTVGGLTATGTIFDNDIFANPDTGGTINAVQGGTAVANVLANDVIYGGTATLADVSLNVINAATNAGVQLNTATGAVTVAPGTPAGTYTITYEICQLAGAFACAQTDVTITVAGVADLQITKTLISNPVLLGGSVQYSLVVLNNGPSTATDVTITDVPPAALSSVQFSTDGGTTWTTWTSPTAIGTLANGASTTVLLRGTVSASQCAPFTNTASVSSSTIDQVSGNNSSNATATPVDPLDLTLTSAPSTTNQIGCINTGIEPIVYNAAGVGNNVLVTGLPPGVTSQLVNGVLTITGSPNQFGTWNYNITSTSACNSVQRTGTIATLQGTSGTWTGAFDNDWFNCKNWANGIVPNNTVDVVIPNTATVTPVINPNSIFAPSNGIATAKSITVSKNLDFASGAILNVSGDVLIPSGGSINMTNGGEIALTGNWTDNAGANGLIQGTGLVTLAGNQLQTITGGETFNNLKIAQGAGPGTGVTLVGNVIVSNTLTLTQGIINSRSDGAPGLGLLTLGPNAAPVAGNPGPTSYVNGALAKEFTTAATVPYVLPVGDAAAATPYRPASVLPSGSGATGTTTFTAEYRPSTPPSPDNALGNVVGLSTAEYWQIDRTGTGTPLDAKVILPYTKNPGSPNWSGPPGGPCPQCPVAIAKLFPSPGNVFDFWDFSKNGGFDPGVPEFRYPLDDGPIYSDVFTSFGAFGFGYGYDVILAVKLVYFEGKIVNKDGVLSWKVSGGEELLKYELETGTDGTTFRKIADIAETGKDVYQYIDKALAPGLHYYRLVMIPKNGSRLYSNIVLLKTDRQPTRIIGLSSTVVTNRLQTKIYSAVAQKVHAQVFDMAGRLFGEYKGDLKAGNNEWPINLQIHLTGMYFIRVTTEDDVKGSLRFFKE